MFFFHGFEENFIQYVSVLVCVYCTCCLPMFLHTILGYSVHTQHAFIFNEKYTYCLSASVLPKHNPKIKQYTCADSSPTKEKTSLQGQAAML